MKLRILIVVGCALLSANIVLAGFGTVCDPRPLGGHSCPTTCGSLFECAPAGGGFSCNVTPASVPGFCKVATVGGCTVGTPCPGTCVADPLISCSCDPISNGGNGPC